MQVVGIDHRGESQHRMGRTDAVLVFEEHVYVVEIKYADTDDDFPSAWEKAMDQIKSKQYYKPYLNQGKKVHLLALAFTKGEVVFEEEVM